MLILLHVVTQENTIADKDSQVFEIAYWYIWGKKDFLKE